MSERQERLQNRLQPEIREFRDGCRTLQLATVDGEGNPNASYGQAGLYVGLIPLGLGLIALLGFGCKKSAPAEPGQNGGKNQI